MLQLWLTFFIGLMIGWLLEWIIDWQFWRKSIASLRAENAALRRQLAAAQAGASTADPAPDLEEAAPVAPAGDEGHADRADANVAESK